MNPAAHSSLSVVWIEAKASRTSPGSSPMSGYIPFSARWMASVLISSRVRSRFSCSRAQPRSTKIKTNAADSRTRRCRCRGVGTDCSSVVCMTLPWIQPTLTGLFRCRLEYDIKRSSQKIGAGSRSSPAVGETRPSLKSELQPQLNGATATRPNDRVGGRHIGCRTTATEATRRGIVMCKSVLSTKRVGEVGWVKIIEKFRAELGRKALAEFPILGNGEIYVAETSVAENVAAHCAEGPERGRNHEGLAVRIATECI